MFWKLRYSFYWCCKSRCNIYRCSNFIKLSTFILYCKGFAKTFTTTLSRRCRTSVCSKTEIKIFFKEKQRQKHNGKIIILWFNSFMTEVSVKLLQQLKSDFKRAINWNKYTSEPELLRQNVQLNLLVKPSLFSRNKQTFSFIIWKWCTKNK